MAEIPQIYDIAKTLYDKLINYMVRYDNLKESMAEERELLMFQSGLLMVAKCMYSDGLENMTEEDFIKQAEKLYKDKIVFKAIERRVG